MPLITLVSVQSYGRVVDHVVARAAVCGLRGVTGCDHQHGPSTPAATDLSNQPHDVHDVDSSPARLPPRRNVPATRQHRNRAIGTPGRVGVAMYRRPPMESDILVGIGLIVVLGVGLQWLARLIRFPSIVLLLAGGLVVGPWLGWLDSDEILGQGAVPVRVAGRRDPAVHRWAGAALRASWAAPSADRCCGLVTLGVLITWVADDDRRCTCSSDGPVRVSVLLGAILVVSGPTVVIPLLRLCAPAWPVATILTWEGIVIDPIGATLEPVLLQRLLRRAPLGRELWGEFVVVALAGVVTGVVGGRAAAGGSASAARPCATSRWRWRSCSWWRPTSSAEQVRPEAGLFATTTMGVVLANQRLVAIRQLRLFGDPIVSLLIGSLFIVLASRVEPGSILDHSPPTLVLVAVLVLVVRPLVVSSAPWARTSLTTRGPDLPRLHGAAGDHRRIDRGLLLAPPAARSASPARSSCRSPSPSSSCCR